MVLAGVRYGANSVIFVLRHHNVEIHENILLGHTMLTPCCHVRTIQLQKPCFLLVEGYKKRLFPREPGPQGINRTRKKQFFDSFNMVEGLY